jgi:hypothetical protein
MTNFITNHMRHNREAVNIISIITWWQWIIIMAVIFLGITLLLWFIIKINIRIKTPKIEIEMGDEDKKEDKKEGGI